jgi:hypothetical protein
MQITPEVRAELERRGWELDAPGLFYFKDVKDSNDAFIGLFDGTVDYVGGPVAEVTEAIAITGGYRLVKEELTQTWLDKREAMFEERTIEAQMEYHLATVSLAAALSPQQAKEEDGRGG